MAQDCALKYEDANGITGESFVTSLGGEDVAETSEVMQVQHAVASPRDRASGQATGRRFHEPLRVLKRIDKATPQLFKALVENQVLPQLVLMWFRPNPADGSTELYFKVTLMNASVVKVAPELQFTRDPESAVYPAMEWVEFVYQKIAYEWTDGGIVHEDDWSAPSA